MSDAVRTFIVFAGIVLAAILIVQAARLVLEAVRLHRIKINNDLVKDNKRLRLENGVLRDSLADADAERRVHRVSYEIAADEINRLTKENEELKAGTPVCTGFTFVK